MCSPRAVNPEGLAGESMANYLVTGAAGFIASKVAELLAAEGHQITGIDDLNDAYDPRLKHWRLAVFASAKPISATARRWSDCGSRPAPSMLC